jgi:hypothetical protein
MPRLRVVEFWHSEFPTALLSERGMLLPIRRLEKAGTVVAASYTSALRAGGPVQASSSWVRFEMDPDCVSFTPEPFLADPSLGEVHRVPVSLDWLDAPPSDLHLLTSSLVSLAGERGWPVEPLSEAARRAEEAHLEHSSSATIARLADGRRVVLSTSIDDSGDAWLTASTVGARGGDPVQLGRWPTGETAAEFAAVRTSVQWSSGDEFTLDPWPLFPPSNWRGVGPVTVRT